MKEYVCNISTVSDKDFIDWYHQMLPSRQEKCKRLNHETAQKQCIGADHLIKTALADYWNCPLDEVSYSVSPSGKPYVEGNPVYFSISHSGNMVFCALSEFPIGVDIEQIRPIPEKAWRRIFTENELNYISSAEHEQEKTRRFFTLWTRKEAIFKVQGILPRRDRETDVLTLSEDWIGKTWEENGYMISVLQWKNVDIC